MKVLQVFEDIPLQMFLKAFLTFSVLSKIIKVFKLFQDFSLYFFLFIMFTFSEGVNDFKVTRVRGLSFQYCFKILEIWKRNSRPEVFYKKGVLGNFTKFTGKHLCQSLSLNKVSGLRPETLLKKRLWHRCFPVNFEKLLRTLIL